MSTIAYYRVSTADQTIASQRAAMGGSFDEEFDDVGVGGAIMAAKRPGFARLLAFIRKGDTLHVYAVDRLGRDALDVQSTVRLLLDKGVAVHVRGLGVMAKGAGELILAVLAQVADMEHQRIAEHTAAGRQVARDSLLRTGLTHRGKQGLGRPVKLDAAKVARWRRDNGASLANTAVHWSLSLATVKRYCASQTKALSQL